MATLELNNKTWQQFAQADFAVIDCYGDQCMACVMLAPVYDGVADELPEVAFGRINITHEPDIADQFGITAMPTLLYFRHGELIDQSIGSIEREQLLEYIGKLLYQ